MAEGKWVIVPGNLTQSGKPERRYQMKSGQFRETEPNSAEWYNQMYKQPFQEMLGAPERTGRSMENLINQLGGYNKNPLNPVSPTEAVLDSSGRNAQGADLNMEAIKRLAAEFDKTEPTIDPVLKPQIVSDDASARDSALTSMRAQYAPGADIWSTDEGKEILRAAKTNSYGGDAAGLAQFNTQQRQAGIGANPEIIEALGYEGNMAEWAKANPALAMREYNKKFGNSGVFSPDAYEGEGSGDVNSVLANGMTAGEDQEAAIKNAEAIIRGTGSPRESNTEVMAPAQNTDMQGQNNRPLDLSMIGEYAPDIKGLDGKNLLQEYAARVYGGN